MLWVRVVGSRHRVRPEYRVLLREAPEGSQQPIQFATGLQLVESAQAMKHPLLDAPIDALILDQEQVGAIPVGLSADEQALVYAITLIPLSIGNLVRQVKDDFDKT